MATIKSQAIQDIEWAIGMNYWSLKMCGIWHSENNSHWYNALLNILVIFYVIISISSWLPQIFALFKVWGNMTLVAENIMNSLPYAVIIMEIMIMWFKKKVIVTMMNFIRDDWSKIKSDDERQVMIKFAQISRMLTLGGFLSLTTTTIIYILPILFGDTLRTLNNITDTGNRPLLFQSVYLIDVYVTPIYELTIISQMISCSVVGFFYTTVGALFGTVVLHVCSQLKNLSIRLEFMMKNNKKAHENFKIFFILNVMEHQRLIRFVDMIENTFNIILLAILPMFTITISVEGLALIDVICSNVKGSMLEIVFSIMNMGYVAFVMCVYSLVGQALETQSKEIQHAAYMCEWNELQSKEAAMLVIILIRSQRPLQITAGKFVPLSLTTFATLLKTTAGYLSCLLAVHE